MKIISLITFALSTLSNSIIVTINNKGELSSPPFPSQEQIWYWLLSAYIGTQVAENQNVMLPMSMDKLKLNARIVYWQK